ncbi:MAG: hypothetical protein H7318_17575 [Oligoflexus sp.]|nr:hypothetical protein [Oligoflexus sp.]
MVVWSWSLTNNVLNDLPWGTVCALPWGTVCALPWGTVCSLPWGLLPFLIRVVEFPSLDQTRTILQQSSCIVSLFKKIALSRSKEA